MPVGCSDKTNLCSPLSGAPRGDSARSSVSSIAIGPSAASFKSMSHLGDRSSQCYHARLYDLLPTRCDLSISPQIPESFWYTKTPLIFRIGYGKNSGSTPGVFCENSHVWESISSHQNSIDAFASTNPLTPEFLPRFFQWHWAAPHTVFGPAIRSRIDDRRFDRRADGNSISYRRQMRPTLWPLACSNVAHLHLGHLNK